MITTSFFITQSTSCRHSSLSFSVGCWASAAEIQVTASPIVHYSYPSSHSLRLSEGVNKTCIPLFFHTTTILIAIWYVAFLKRSVTKWKIKSLCIDNYHLYPQINNPTVSILASQEFVSFRNRMVFLGFILLAVKYILPIGWLSLLLFYYFFNKY